MTGMMQTVSQGSRSASVCSGRRSANAAMKYGGRMRANRGCDRIRYAQFDEWNGVRVAQKIQTLFIDDIDGSEAEGTVRFALDGAEYEIDLNAKHAEALRKALSRYVEAARRSSA